MLIEVVLSKSVLETVDIFKSLGDATRLKIIKLIVLMGNNLCVGMIAHKLDISQPAVSQHLKILKNTGLVEAERMGFHMHYRVKNGALDEYGIDLNEFLKTIEFDFVVHENCKSCDSLNI